MPEALVQLLVLLMADMKNFFVFCETSRLIEHTTSCSLYAHAINILCYNLDKGWRRTFRNLKYFCQNQGADKMKFQSVFTTPRKSTSSQALSIGQCFDHISFRSASSEIKNPDGTTVFSIQDIEVPEQFSQVAVDILAQKYFRKAGVPAILKKVEENNVPSWLWRSVPDTKALNKLEEGERFGGETSAKQVFSRLAGTWTYWGWKAGYFSSEEDAHTYYAEMVHMLATQMAAPNSPQWFNTGLHWAYGIDGPSQGHFYVDYESGKMVRSSSSYEHPVRVFYFAAC